MAKDVAAFFSYSRDDSSFVVRLAADLKAAGSNVWLDQLDITPGERWDRAIEDALKSCQRLIVILSPTAVESTNVMDEVSFALEERKTVIPVIYKDCEIPFRLRRLQHLDFKQDYAHGLNELLKALAPQQGPEPGAPASHNMRDQVRKDIPEVKQLETEPEQTSLEDKVRKAADQAQPEVAFTQTPARDSRSGFISTLPAGAKVGVAAFVLLIVGFVLYWAFLATRSTKQTAETQTGAKRVPEVETTNAVSPSPQRPQDTQKQEPKVEATAATTAFVVDGPADAQTVLDTRTGLMWTRKDYWDVEQRYATSWYDAMAWAKKMNAAAYAGYSDWSVPTIAQYRTINSSKADRDVYARTFETTKGTDFWASNTPSQYVASYITFAGPDAGFATSGGRTGQTYTGGELIPMSVRLVRVK